MEAKIAAPKEIEIFWVMAVATLLLAAGIFAVLIVKEKGRFQDWTPYSKLARFSSYDALKEYVGEANSDQSFGYATEGRGNSFGISPAPMSPGLSDDTSGSGGSGQPDYSSTNIQVEGVDEADIVKTDGEYIYAVSDMNVTVLKAYPVAPSGVASKIALDDAPSELFLGGDRLVVIQQSFPGMTPMEDRVSAMEYGYYYYYTPNTVIGIYDVTDPSSPALVREVSVNGSYFDARMIGDHIYVIATQYLVRSGSDVVMPIIADGSEPREVEATEIGYFDEPAPSYVFTLVLSLNVKDDEGLTSDIFLADTAQTMYASLDNIYLSSTEYEYSTMRGPISMDSSTEKTWIHKISIDGSKIAYVQSVRVPGTVLNQFSMDEHEGHFRIATTSWSGSSFGGGSESSNVFVLDGSMNVTGRLRGLAPGEQVHSVRFMGDRAYVVTFKKIDPLFVIDLGNPSAPKVLGELKIPGYSDYLHPYDEDHIIGVGKETVEGEGGDFAWYQGVKMSLFDVSDVRNPKEVSKYVVGDRGTDSYALQDHKAFLFDREKNLLVVPILLAEIDESDYGGDVPSWAYGEYVWQGAYVFELTLEHGFVLKGTVTHIDDMSTLDDYWYYYYQPPDYVKRALYIEDCLYTISEKTVKINDLGDLSELKEIEL